MSGGINNMFHQYRAGEEKDLLGVKILWKFLKNKLLKNKFLLLSDEIGMCCLGTKQCWWRLKGLMISFWDQDPTPTVSPNKFHSALVGNESLVLPPRQKLKEGLER